MSQHLKALNRERYARVAQNYVVSSTHATGMGLERMIEWAQPRSDWRVLDVATGGGHTALFFAPHVAQVIATDFTPIMLDAARAFITARADNVIFCGADAENLSFASAAFDAVTCRVAAHHFPDIFAFVRSAARLLKAGGHLLVYDHVVADDERVARYVNAYEKLRDPAHARILPEYEWRGVCLDTGLTIETIEHDTVIHQVLPWAQRQNCTRQTIEQLQVMLLRAPQAVRDWMQPTYAGTDYATHTAHNILLHARKPSA